MANSYIPAWHFISPAKKLTPAWCEEAVNATYFNANNRNLLEGKNVSEIEGYASGNFSMTEFKKMYRSMRSALDAAESANNENYSNKDNINTVGVGFVPLPMLPTKINAAHAIIHKIPVEIRASAMDSLAAKKKNSDLTFLKNKPALEADMQDLADQMQIGKVDLGTTKHSAVAFSDSPYGLDLNEPDELQVFVDLLYNLSVETAFETALQQFWEIKKGSQVKGLEIRDQLKFGVSVNSVFESSMTGLPDMEYVYPSSMETPESDLPDYSDNTHRFKKESLTALELFNKFGNEICDENTLDKILNEKVTGYCACNGAATQPSHNFGTFKLDLIKCEIKSIDYVGVAPVNKKSKYNSLLTEDEDNKDEVKKCTKKIWGQNTYVFWWLKHTKHFFGIHRLGYSHRTLGVESIQNFSTNIFRSQKKSAVELSIGENKKAQIADIKMQHAIIKSLPAGKYIDLKYLRSALSGLVQENNKWTMQDLINLAFEQNMMIGDTQDFEGSNEGQFKPLQEISGGLKTEIVGYMQVIADAAQKISQFTGINEQLTGQAANPEGLIGLQKLLINSSINALNYANEAIEKQYQAVFNTWATVVKAAIERGGKAKEAIVNLVGAKKVSLIDALDEIPLHQMGIKVDIHQREEERQVFREEIARLKLNNVINTVDEYMLEAVTNPKDKMALLAVKYKQWEKKQERQRAEDMQHQQQMVAQQGENQQAAMKQKVAGDVEKVYAQGDVSANIMNLASQLGMSGMQLKGLIDQQLQQNRGNDQLNKNVKTLETKATLENQKPFGE